MGTRFTVGGIDFNAADYSVTEDSTGLSLNDSSGGVGEVRVSVDKPSPEEIRDMPSPYPDAVTLTPIFPGYYEDPDDFIATYDTTSPAGFSYQVVDIDPSNRGATRAVRVTLPPSGRITFLPNGGARILRDQGLKEDFRLARDPETMRFLPSPRPRDPRTGAHQVLAASIIVREIADSQPDGIIFYGSWRQSPGNPPSADLRYFDTGVEYGIPFQERPRDLDHVVPDLTIVNSSLNSGTIVFDLVMAGVFSLSERTDPNAWRVLFSGFQNKPAGYVTSWDSGSPSGLASRYSRTTPEHAPWVRGLAPTIFEGMNFILEDSEYGRIPGVIEGVSETDDSWEFTGVSTLGLFNNQDVILSPFEGTASQVLREFVRAAGWPWTPIYVDPGVDSEVLRLGRQQGELWNLMKQFASGLGAEISLVDGVLVLRRPRVLLTEAERYFARAVAPSNQDARPGVILQTEELSTPEVGTTTTPGPEVYPGGQLNSLLPVVSVLGGGSVELDVTLGYEVGGLYFPVTAVDPIDPERRVVSVFDDLNVKVGEFFLEAGPIGRRLNLNFLQARKLEVQNKWYRRYLGLSTASTLSYGRSFEFSLSVTRIPSEDRTVRVEFRAPRVVDSDGRERTFFLSAIQGGAQVNGFQLNAPWGMKIGPLQSSEFPTGSSLAPSDAPEVLYTKSVSWNADRISSAGYAAARRASGRYRNLNGTVDRLRPPHESNYYTSAPYSDAQGFVGGSTYGGVVGVYDSVVSPVDYGGVQRYWDQNYESSIKTWVFGNVAGSRIWDEASNNFYRVRSATITPSGISLSAETDTVHGDVDPLYASEGLSYSDVTSRSQGYIHLSYEQASASGYLKDPANA